MRGEPVSQKAFSALRASVWSKNKGGGCSPLDLPLARLIFNRSDFHTSLQFYIHYTGCQLKFRIEIKMMFVTFKAIYGLAPSYICELINIKESGGYNLRSNRKESSYKLQLDLLLIRHLVTVPSSLAATPKL